MQKKCSCYVAFPSPEYTNTHADILYFLAPVSSGTNSIWQVKLGSGILGYFKSCRNTDPVHELLEVWLSNLGQQLGVGMTHAALIYDCNGNRLGYFTEDAGSAGIAYHTAQQLKEHWLMKLHPVPPWAVRAAEIHHSAPKIEPFPDHRFSVIEDETLLSELVQFVYNLLSADGKWDVRKGFTDMVLFDCMLRQKDRNMQGFGLVETFDGNAIFADLYDNATILMPGLPEDANGFCNILCSWQLLATVTAKLFPAEALDFSERLELFLTDHSDRFMKWQNDLVTEDYSRHLNRCEQSWNALPAIIRNAAESI